MNLKSEPLVIWASILVALQVLTAGAALTDVIGEDTAALCILVVAALQAGTQFYVRSQVTPNASVAARVNSSGEVVAGDASSVANDKEVILAPKDG